MQRILSGMQPTGNLHLGNYLGALKNWVALQETHECYYCAVDLHAITVPQDPVKLKQSVRETAAAYIAAGIDTSKSKLFAQSAVPAHAELMWILATLTPLGWLNRMTQFKEKTKPPVLQNAEQELYDHYKTQISEDTLPDDHMQSAAEFIEKFDLENRKRHEAANKEKLGLYAYPVLMAADILIYKANAVPVGEDQKQHLELTRDIATAFNLRFGVEYFPLPEPMILGAATRVMSLRDGTKKMSKSDESDYSRINLTDDADAIALKIRKAKTDPEPLPDNLKALEARPEADNLVTIYAALAGIERETALAAHAGQTFSTFKTDLTDLAVMRLSPITQKMRDLLADPAEIDRVLRTGADAANELTQKHLREVKEIVGLWS